MSRWCALQIFGADGRIQNWDGYIGMLEYIFYKQLGWPVGDEACAASLTGCLASHAALSAMYAVCCVVLQ